MGAKDIKLSADLEAEFSPHAAILANNRGKFDAFAVYLERNGFPAKVYDSLRDPDLVNPRAGTVFFVSFNLNGSDVASTVRLIEENLHMTAVVFAEKEDFKTAASLSSAKMSHTLQHPYTEKNFLMAMQNIVKKRRAEHEKELRKQTVHDRRKGAATVEPDVKKPSFIIQKGAAGEGGAGTQVIKGDAEKVKSIIQEGQAGDSFLILQQAAEKRTKIAHLTGDADEPAKTIVAKGTAPTAANATASAPAEAKTAGVIPEPEVSLTKVDNSAVNPAAHSTASAATAAVTPLASDTPPPAQAPATNTQQSVHPVNLEKFQQPPRAANSEYSLLTICAVVITCLIGSLICFYCLYEMLRN